MTPGAIAQAIEGVIRGGVGVAANIHAIFRDRQNLSQASERIDRMLRNPRKAFRSTVALATELNDKEPPYTFTTTVLTHIGARRDKTGKELWILEDNWEWDPPGPNQITQRVRKKPDGTYVLKPGIDPANH
jgi:hypothetical protein